MCRAGFIRHVSVMGPVGGGCKRQAGSSTTVTQTKREGIKRENLCSILEGNRLPRQQEHSPLRAEAGLLHDRPRTIPYHQSRVPSDGYGPSARDGKVVTV